MGKYKCQEIERMAIRWVWTLCITCLCIYKSGAQQNTQLWLDYQVNYPFAVEYLFQVEASYQTELINDSTWRSANLTPAVEYGHFSSLDLKFYLPLSYTTQTKDYNSFETRPTIEAHLFITQNKRVNTGLLFKVEKRFFFSGEENEWSSSTRVRMKAEATISINERNLYHDNLWYAIVDYEEYVITDRELDERYSNRRRARLGAGYRLNYKNRFEVVYSLQSSRNELEGEFVGTDNVIQLRYKMYLNPAKPSPSK
jgi:hypothetical protein